MDLIKAYRMYNKMMQHPHLIDEIREIFLTCLISEKGFTLEALRNEALNQVREVGLEENEEAIKEVKDALIDLHFAEGRSESEIEDHINLARKRDRFRNLTAVINTEDVTSRRIQRALKEFCDIPEGRLFIPPNEAEVVRVALINHFISNQLSFIGVAKKHLTTRDVFDVVQRSHWNERRSGKIGGKAAGMLLAYRIVLPRLMEKDPELAEFVRIPESYYFNSGIFSDFIEFNDLHRCHSLKYEPQENMEKAFEEIGEEFERAEYPKEVVSKFRSFLEEIGEQPLILRSSSLLEDSLGHAFSGKYESVFVANQGDLDTRLKDFIRGLKQVHLSTISPGALAYRRERNLLDFDERMSVLVQNVVGRRFGDNFFPFAAGVAFSVNAYNWSPKIQKEEGMVRMVFGLGTRAVDRVVRDYPRMVPLSHPQLRPEVTADEIQKYSQRLVDAVNLSDGRLETKPYLELLEDVEHPELFYAVSVREDMHLSAPMFKGGTIPLAKTCLTFENLLSKTPFIRIMKKILSRLHQAYGGPIEVEFAWDDNKFYLLQCRSHPVREEFGLVTLPEEMDPERVLFTNNRGITNSAIRNIEYLVYVDPKAYANIETHREKLAVGRVVGELNRRLYRKRFALFGPGRWGSNDITLGVKVGYQDINNTLILGEISFEEDGFAPEVSYGTHFFNDLVEARIVPVAVYPDDDGVVFNEAFILGSRNSLAEWIPEYACHAASVHVIHIPSAVDGRLLHVLQDGLNQQGIGYFGFKEAEVSGSPGSGISHLRSTGVRKWAEPR